MKRFETVCVIGLGYIGLPTAAVFAKNGIDVVGVDVNQDTVNGVNAGHPHITEPELDDLVRTVVKSGRLRAAVTAEAADAFIIAVPTPFDAERKPDVSYVAAAARSLAPHLKAGNLVVLESTCPVGATDQLGIWLAEERPDLTFPHTHAEQSDIRIAHCPERVLPGQILKEVVHNDRVIGGQTVRCGEEAMALYRTFVKGDCHLTTARTAELAKLSENAFRDVNIAFANELSVICGGLGIDVWELIRVANLHPRVNILRPGPGVGGHCIAVDPWFIVAADPANARVIRAAREVNSSMPTWVVDRVKEAALAFDRPTIACLGLAYKADIGDLRESPAVEIVAHLKQDDVGEILVVEPHADRLPPSLEILGLRLSEQSESIRKADIVLLLVDHRTFVTLDPEQLKGKKIIDTRGVW